jgi:fatty-acyl-CoA synthase
MAWALGCSGAFLDDAVALSGLPLFHVNAVHVTGLGPFMHGASVVSLRLGYRAKALMAEFWQIIAHHRVTTFSGVPMLYESLPPVPDEVDLSSLHAGVVGAAPLPSRVRGRFESSVYLRPSPAGPRPGPVAYLVLRPGATEALAAGLDRYSFSHVVVDQ